MIEITWLGHGTFQLRLENGEIVLIDPWINGNPKSPQGFKIDNIDTMLITHGHFDHVADAVQLAKKFKPQVISNFEICAWLETKGVQNTGGMNKGGSQTAGSLKVTMTHALHSAAFRMALRCFMVARRPASSCTSPMAVRPTSRATRRSFQTWRCTASCTPRRSPSCPSGDYYTMDPKQAALAVRLIGAKKIIPVHFGTFPILTGTPAELAALVKADGVDVWELQPGVPVRW